MTALPVKPGAELQDAAAVPAAPGLVHFFRFGHLMLIPTLVNREPVSMFLVDTGAWSPVVSTSLARRIGKPGKSSMFGVKGVSGKVNEVYEAHAVTVAFAGFASRQNLMLSFDFSRMNESTGTETSGILGMPMLEVFRFTIDYQNGTIRFEHRTAVRSAMFEPLSGLKLNQISIIMLGVADIERSVAFYRDRLGLTREKPDAGIRFPGRRHA